MTAPGPTPLGVYGHLRDAYLRYVDTAFWLRDEALMAERRRLLERDGLLFTDALLEPVIPYDSTDALVDVCRELGLTERTARLLGEALLAGFGDPERPLIRKHQATALRTALGPAGPGRNPIITSGTGSGKTESFLLPVLGRLIEESARWGGPDPIHEWWRPDAEGDRWRSVRSREHRPAALRAVVLYPTNALVEDQVSRLRAAMRRLLAAPGGPRLWFGRYTGATIGGTRMPTARRLGERERQAATELRELAEEFDRVAARGDLSREFSDPRTGEMLTRWDMVADPPDILVTNYSMLNVMLMRSFEEPMFSRTAEWLAADVRNVLTLVVDELHLYRGTQGSEVAMIIRSFLDRLGLDGGSEQLRIIATSASLSAERAGLDYLEAFFGRRPLLVHGHRWPTTGAQGNAPARACSRPGRERCDRPQPARGAGLPGRRQIPGNPHRDDCAPPLRRARR